VDPSGKPAGGAVARKPDGNQEEDWFGGSGIPRTDAQDQEPPIAASADGRVEITVPAGQAISLEFGGPYWRAQTRRIQPLRADEVADFGEIALTPASRLVGKTLDPAGKPLGGVLTRLRAADAGMFWEGHQLIQSRTSDAQGEVVFEGVPLGRFRVEGEAIGFASSLIEALEVRAAPGDMPFQLKLDPGARVAGRVVDADRRPVAGAELFLFRLNQEAVFWGDYQPPFPSREPDAVSAADGSFAMLGIPLDDKSVMIGARAEGQVNGFAKKVKAGMTEVTVILPRALSVRGRVLGKGDAPIADAHVSLTQKTPWGWDDQKASANTGADGSFVLEGLAPGQFLLHASAAGAEAEPLSLALDHELSDIVLRLTEKPALVVKVTDPEGHPLAQSSVEASAAQDTGGDSQNVVISSEGSFSYLQNPHWSSSVTTDAAGLARIYGAPSGELRIQTKNKDWARSDVNYNYNGGEAETTITLQRPAQLLVRVTDGAGGMVRNVAIRLRDPASGRESEEQKTDNLGRAFWPDLLPGPWEILHGAGGGGGNNFFEGSIAFSTDLVAEPEAAPQAGQLVELTAGQCLEKEIIVNDLAVVTVRVLRNGAPAADVFVRLEARSDEEGGETENYWGGGMHGGGPAGLATDGRGVVVLDPIAAGKYYLISRPSRSAPETKQKVDLVVGPQTLTAQLNGAEVRGVVRSSSGPVVGARLTLTPWAPEGEQESRRSSMVISMISSDGNMAIEFGDSGAGNTSASSDQDGEFLFEDVPEGQWVIESKARGFAPWTSLPFSVTGDQTVNLPEQLLLPGGEISGRDHNWKAKSEEEAFNFDWNNSIRLEGADGQMVGMAQAMDGGEFKFTDLADGEYFLRRGEWKSEALKIAAGERRRLDIPVAAPKDEN
jgi:hypothetical protein